MKYESHAFYVWTAGKKFISPVSTEHLSSLTGHHVWFSPQEGIPPIKHLHVVRGIFGNGIKTSSHSKQRLKLSPRMRERERERERESDK